MSRLPDSSPQSRSGSARSLEISFPTGCRRRSRSQTQRRVLGRPSPAVSKIRMMGFRRTASMASAHNYSSFVPSPSHREIDSLQNRLGDLPKILTEGYSHGNFAIRLFLELQFAHFLCAAQEMSMCPKNEFRRLRRPSRRAAWAPLPRRASSGIRRSSDARARQPACRPASSDRCASRPWRQVHP